MSDVEKDIKNRVKQYKNFPGYKGRTDIELARIAEVKIRIDNLVDDLDVEGQFENKDEAKEARALAKKYFSDYTFEFISDKNALKQLIFLEVLNKRIQKMLNDFYKDSASVPIQMLDGLHKNITQITSLKESLGLTKDGKEEGKSDALTAIDTLKRKFKKWREENNGSRTVICPECSKMILLKMRTDMWETQKHPYFIDRFLGNKELFRLLEIGRLTRKEVADILQTSQDYIDWIVNKLQPNRVAKSEFDTIKDDTATSNVTQQQMPLEATTSVEVSKDECLVISTPKTDLEINSLKATPSVTTDQASGIKAE